MTTTTRTAKSAARTTPDKPLGAQVLGAQAREPEAEVQDRALVPAQEEARLPAAPAQNPPLALRDSPGREQPRAYPTLAAALATAAARCQPVEKTAENTYHRYKYASAEAIIGEAKRAMAGTGVALVPVAQACDWHPEGPDGGRWELTRKWLLIHTSGEVLPLQCAWPICPEKGRPLDKATAIAATLSLAYQLRDLLQIPRVDESDDATAREDRPAPVKGPPANAPARTAAGSPAPPPPPNGPAPPPRLELPREETLREEVRALAAELGRDVGWLDEKAAIVAGQPLPEGWTALSADQLEAFASRLRGSLEKVRAAEAAQAAP